MLGGFETSLLHSGATDAQPNMTPTRNKIVAFNRSKQNVPSISRSAPKLLRLRFTMTDPSGKQDPRFGAITNRKAHDQLVAQCTKGNIPTILHVYNSAVPRCQTFLVNLEMWAKNRRNEDSIQYAKMDYTTETSFMFKFASNQLPITVLMVGERWARTVTGAELGEIERMVEEMVDQHRMLTG